MSLLEDPIGPVFSLPLAPSSASSPNTVGTASPFCKLSCLPEASSPYVRTVLASGVSLATSLAVLPQAASILIFC